MRLGTFDACRHDHVGYQVLIQILFDLMYIQYNTIQTVQYVQGTSGAAYMSNESRSVYTKCKKDMFCSRSKWEWYFNAY